MGQHQLRGGMVLPYTSQDAAEHPESFWCLDSLQVNPSTTSIDFVFRGWHSVEAYDADAAPIADASRNYGVQGMDYYALIGQSAPVGTIAAAIIQMAWAAVSQDEFFAQAVPA